ncbi:Protein N-acetyltransferase, RimJ/RimL family [Mucilaginibacter lappiensis]|uniref:RimJ/RimL family protein N-acetyltransferase n=1 Tax=Mucilaginibacter lappiensis TaxID=354630 RepID=A0ABR6PKK9_9SPHI|nr:GNAT family protein [Mucilaginibacter lappiensis]MBB6110307.1 RimJ/RimL family protein N-acetyltransferase [Mucilaginibacter lappiensis]SIR29948.1 Protein N-acetyltransferase, RimJ/RimL family [Mucilaginibacter lappiensis]
MELQGSTFTLRGWFDGDEESLQKHADNPKVSAFLLDRFPYPYSLSDAITWVAFMKKQATQTNFAIAIDGQVCGGIAVDMKVDANHNEAEIGYWLAETYWGRGIITEAVQLLTRYAFETFGIIRVQAGVFGKNTASMRVLEKAGYVKEGIMRNALIKKGVVMDKHLYAILKPE